MISVAWALSAVSFLDLGFRDDLPFGDAYSHPWPSGLAELAKEIVDLAFIAHAHRYADLVDEAVQQFLGICARQAQPARHVDHLQQSAVSLGQAEETLLGQSAVETRRSLRKATALPKTQASGCNACTGDDRRYGEARSGTRRSRDDASNEQAHAQGCNASDVQADRPAPRHASLGLNCSEWSSHLEE